MLALDKTNDTSFTLDALRAVAAQIVCIGHGLAFFEVGSSLRPPSTPSMQNVGVLLFFLMSGFLITATLFRNADDPNYSFSRYFIDRFSRIYSGLVPALAFVIVIDGVTIWLTSEPTIARYYNFPTLLASLAMLPGYHGIYDQSWLQWSPFGSASPLWTLGIEWHIYMFVGASFFIIRRRRLWLLLFLPLVFFAQTPLHYLAGSLQADGVGRGLFTLWLAGAGTFLLLDRYTPPPLLSALALCLGSAAYLLLVKPGQEYTMSTYPALTLAFAGLVALSQRTAAIRVSRIARVAADYSFTLYLVHHTLFMGIASIFPEARGWAAFVTAVLTANLLAWFIAQHCEMKHKKLAALLLRIVRLAGPKSKDNGRRAGTSSQGTSSPR